MPSCYHHLYNSCSVTRRGRLNSIARSHALCEILYEYLPLILHICQVFLARHQCFSPAPALFHTPIPPTLCLIHLNHAWSLQGGLETRKIKIALSTTRENMPLSSCCSAHRQRSSLGKVTIQKKKKKKEKTNTAGLGET